MSAEIVNLRQARKRAERAAREDDAAQNRALHGRPKAEIERSRKEARRLDRDLDNARRVPADPSSSDPS